MFPGVDLSGRTGALIAATAQFSRWHFLAGSISPVDGLRQFTTRHKWQQRFKQPNLGGPVWCLGLRDGTCQSGADLASVDQASSVGLP